MGVPSSSLHTFQSPLCSQCIIVTPQKPEDNFIRSHQYQSVRGDASDWTIAVLTAGRSKDLKAMSSPRPSPIKAVQRSSLCCVCGWVASQSRSLTCAPHLERACHNIGLPALLGCCCGTRRAGRGHAAILQMHLGCICGVDYCILTAGRPTADRAERSVHRRLQNDPPWLWRPTVRCSVDVPRGPGAQAHPLMNLSPAIRLVN